MKLLILLSICLFLFTNVSFGKGDKILVVRKGQISFTTVYIAITNELKENYTFTDYVIDKSTEYKKFKAKVKEINPVILVLMDNQTIKFAIKYNKEEKIKIRGVALMGLNLKRLLMDNDYIAGIAYETPAYSLVTQFRFVNAKPVKNVLVYYRGSLFSEMVQTAKERLKTENISVIGVDVEKNGKSRSEVEKFIKSNLKKDVNSGKHDVFWVNLDSGMLNTNLFFTTWIPTARSAKIPFIAGTKKFVSSKLSFCLFAISPNLPDYGTQAAQMIEAILEDEEKPADLGVEDLIAVNKFINMKRAKDGGFKIKKEHLYDVDLSNVEGCEDLKLCK